MNDLKIILTGNNLKIEEIFSLVSNPEVFIELDELALVAVENAKKFLDQNAQDQIIYGFNTGFGPMASYIIGNGEINHLQENLIKSHAVGMGDPIDQDYVLSAMVVRLNTLLRGHSGVSVGLIKRLQTFINKRIIPVVPEHGAVGTSGDLVQLAHIALALIGEGEVFYKSSRRQTVEVLNELYIDPQYKLLNKEGLSLINGTAVMSGIAALLCVRANTLLNFGVKTGALSLELVNGFSDSISERLHSFRPHSGQSSIAKSLRTLLASSKLLQSRSVFSKAEHITNNTHEIPQDVQNVYSLRCIPQILGPVLESLDRAYKVVETEINSTTDNPIIDLENKVFLHGGNFHGDYIAWVADLLKMTLVKLTMLSERRLNFFLNNKINKRFPPFMNLSEPGVNLGLQGLQFVATSTTSQSQTLAFPQYVHSISTNADNQDVVSMGVEATLFLDKVIDNAFIVLTIEMIALAQGVSFSNNRDKLSKTTKELFDNTRKILPAIIKDEVIIDKLDKLVDFFKKNGKSNF